MKKLILFCLLTVALQVVNAQKGINFSHLYSAGRKLGICVDSLARNVHYDNKFPNQPNTSFNYLPDVDNMSIQIYFEKTDRIQHYRYTILVDEKPVVVNKPIDKAQLNDVDTSNGILSYTKFGVFHIKGKVITTLLYSIEKPQDIYKSVFYGKSIPKAKIKLFAKHTKTKKGSGYEYIIAPKDKIAIAFAQDDLGLKILKDRSDIDYLYYTSIRDKQTNKIVFESTAWQYGGYIDESNEFSPYVKVDKSVFKKSGDYEITIQPFIRWNNCPNCNISAKDIEKSTARYTLSVTLDEEIFSKKEVWTYIGFTCALLGLMMGLIMVYIKRKNETKLSAEQHKKNIAQLQLNSVRSQLNPHFLFNALAGIQNLMNKNEIDNANRYLSKFARLTRNVLDSKELISLTDEKTLLDDYLQMEQLRFGFRYTLKASSNLDTENNEIPAMLLQPFVENAVKHGIVEKGNDGLIEVSFEKRSSDLILQIKDNGQGFDSAKTYTGLGLTLSKNRISLLNTIYKETPLVLDIESNINGTTVSVTLTQWL